MNREHLCIVILALCLSIPGAAAMEWTVFPSASYQLAQSKCASSAIAITSDGATLLVVNPDSNSLTLVNTTSSLVIAEVAVGVGPRAVAVSPGDARAYVANQGSDSLSMVDLATHDVAQVAVGDRPAGVAVSPDGRFVAVAELGDDRARFLDATGLRTLSTVAVPDRPHGLAFTPDGQYLLVTHLLSGEVTVLNVQPITAYLPLVFNESQVSGYGFQVLAEPQLSNHSTGRSRQSPHSLVSIPTWPNVAPAPTVLVNAAGTRAYLPQTMANGLGLNTQFDTTVFPKVSVLDLETSSHQTSEHIPLPEKDQPVGLPWDVALAKDDTELWVVNAASNDVSVLDISDPSRPSRVAHVAVGDNPRGIVLSPDGSMVYVNNILAGTASVIDAGTYAVTDVITVTDIPLPPTLLHGKRLFHSSARPDLAQAAWISCNTCHVEGEHDGRTWLLQFIGNAPPGSVVTRNTTSLLGMIETYPLRWSAEWDESADSEFSVRFEQFGTGLIDGPAIPVLGLYDTHL